MQGGRRSNAGRTALPKKEKKEGHKIYINSNLKKEIDTYGLGSSFSEKCTTLIEQKIAVIKQSESKTIRFIDLFAGLGGIRLGFEQSCKELGVKAECVFSSEIKPYAIKAYSKFFNEAYIAGDITKIRENNIPKFDILLAGFPCQPFSSAGKGRGFEDTRGTLFFDIERILKKHQPYGFLLENVEGLINHEKGETLRIIICHLEALGYKVNFNLLDSKNFGLAQSRKRVYIVGTKVEKISLDNFVFSTSQFSSVMEHNMPTLNTNFTRCLFEHYNSSEVLGKAIKDKRGGKNNIHSWDIELKGCVTTQQKELLEKLLKERRRKSWAEIIGIPWMDGMPLTLKQIQTFYNTPNLKSLLDDLVSKGYLAFEHPKKIENNNRVFDTTKPRGYNIVSGKLSFEFTKILNPNGLVPTLVAMDVSKIGVIDGNGLRALTIREGQRLCGFPENYDLSFLAKADAFDLLGNTVCVPVIKAIADRLAQSYVENIINREINVLNSTE